MGKSNSGIKPLHKLTLAVAVTAMLLGIYIGSYYVNRGASMICYADDNATMRHSPTFHVLQKPSEVVYLPLEALGLGEVVDATNSSWWMVPEDEWMSPWLLQFTSRSPLPCSSVRE